jgi:K+-transporting ATPase ATPase C chain
LSLRKEIRRNSSPAIRLAVISMILCGLLFPLLVTGFAQIVFPSQANGSLAHLSKSNSRTVGSYLIAQNFSLPIFFHPRNSSLSASGVDPDITREDARDQVATTISSATGISQSDLYTLIDQNLEGSFWIFGSPYVNVLRLNVALVQDFQSVYCASGLAPIPQYCK